MPRLSLELFGPLRITLDGNPVNTFESVKVRALLVSLALEREIPHTRDKLVGLLWSEHSQERARGNLRRALWNLQQTLKARGVAPFLLITRETIQFNPDADAWADAWAFDTALAECSAHPHRAIEYCRPCVERLERTVALYRGEFLQNFSVGDAPGFEEWLLLQREHYQRHMNTALAQLIRHFETLAAAGHADTERYARRQMELEPWDEEPYRALMRSYAAQAQTEKARGIYHALERVLRQELNLEPSAETKALYKHIGNQTSLAGVSSPQRSAIDVAGLPPPATPLVGREIELAELAEKITRADCRLLTLVGEGGIGKTRLAVEAARANLPAFPRGAYFVDLTAITSFDRVPHAIAEAMHLPPGNGSIAQQLTEHMDSLQEPLLLILDNMEQLLVQAGQGATPAAGAGNDVGMVSAMLQRAPQLTLLVTSRERLNLAEEWLYLVEGLRAPSALPAHITPEWNRTEAVELFVQCAARQNIKTEAWRDQDKRAVMQLTQLVEGMPLAIELASGWLRALAPTEIAEEITRGLDVLTSTRRDLPARHASIRAVFEHSWALLTRAEQDAFARLSVFRGGFTRQAAGAVANAPLFMLAALVDKSLVKRGAAGRFRMHELVRQFAAEKLVLQAARADTATRHADYFLELLAERGNALNTEQARAALTELQHEAENVRAAWEWRARYQSPALLQPVVAPLATFYRVTGLLREGQALLGATLEIVRTQAGVTGETDDATQRALTSEMHTHLAHFAFTTGDFPRTIDEARRAMEQGGDGANLPAVVMSEWLLGSAMDRHADSPSGVAHLEHARRAAEDAHLPLLEAQILTTLANPTYHRYSNKVARATLERALELAERQGDLRLTCDILRGLAQYANHQGALAEAEALLQRLLLLQRALGDPANEVMAYINLGTLAVFQWQFDKAEEHYRHGVALAEEIGADTYELRARVNWAECQLKGGEYKVARQVYEAVRPRAEARGELWSLQNALWGLVMIQDAIGTPERLLEHALAVADLATRTHDEIDTAFAQLGLAYAREKMGELDAAEMLYRSVITVLRAREQMENALLGVEGLARLALTRGDMEEARAWALELLDALTAKFPTPDVNPLRMYWTVRRVLVACGDPRAGTVLETAHTLLLRSAAAIEKPSMRESFLEQVPWNREIQRAYASGRPQHV